MTRCRNKENNNDKHEITDRNHRTNRGALSGEWSLAGRGYTHNNSSDRQAQRYAPIRWESSDLEAYSPRLATATLASSPAGWAGA
jgi:hypothetical protein